MYRIVQEALTNAVKHGGAKRAVVEITDQGGEIRLSVRDDGRGFDPAEQTEGFGLLGMSERMQLLEGALQVESSPSAGTTVTARFPARHRAPASAEPVATAAPQ